MSLNRSGLVSVKLWSAWCSRLSGFCFALLLGLTFGIAAGGSAFAQSIPVPQDEYSMPPELYVLPVFLVPSDQGHLAEDPLGSGLDLDGSPMSSTLLTEYRTGRQNLSTHLRMSQRKYETMLRNPLNGKQRGLFRLASWDAKSGHAVPWSVRRGEIQPLVVHSPVALKSLARAYAGSSYYFLHEVLDAAGCRPTTCPFVFVVAVMGDPLGNAGGLKFNHGYNNGGGFSLHNFRGQMVLASAKGSGVTLQSTLLHEVGHSFGLPHVGDYCAESDTTCPTRLSQDKSQSVMSYNTANHIKGCGYKKRGSNPDDSPCEYPGDAVVDAFPGALVAEDLRVLGMNDRAFGDFTYEKALDAPGLAVRRHLGVGNAPITGFKSLEAGSVHTHTGLSTPPAVLLGADDNPIPQFHDEFDSTRMWHSREVGPGEWARIWVHLPEELTLKGIDVLSGFSSGLHVATGIRVRTNSALVLEDLAVAANEYVPFSRKGYYWNIEVRAGESGHVALRGIRLFTELSGKFTEIYPAAEPRVVETSVGTWGGKLDKVVGTLQPIPEYSKPYDAARAWHSNQVDPGGWVSVTVAFPEAVELGHVKAHTGHSGAFHAAREVQVERGCICGSSGPGSCGAAASAKACAEAGAGETAFEWMGRVSSTPDQLVSFTPREARVWKVAFRTPTKAEQAQDPGYLYLRGLRFFDSAAAEIFPARFKANGL